MPQLNLALPDSDDFRHAKLAVEAAELEEDLHVGEALVEVESWVDWDKYSFLEGLGVVR